MKFATIALLAFGASICYAGGLRGTVGPANTNVELPNSVVPVLQQAKFVGRADTSERIYVAVNLQPRDLNGLQSFCDDVSNPSSINYKHFLTPVQVGQRFGASAQDVANVVSYLRSEGMTVDHIASNNLTVCAWTTVAQAEKAFSTKINNYVGADPENKSITFRANETPLTVPLNLSSVTYVEGISNYYRPKAMTTLTPALVRTLYNIAPAFNANFQGQGRRIGYSNWDHWRISNGVGYITYFGLPVPAGGAGSNIHQVQAGANLQGVDGSGEGDLDLEMELAVAPLADIYVYDGSTLTGVLSREQSDNYDIISESWGWSGGAGSFDSAHNIHLTMTAQGMTYMCASGDSGASGTNGTYYYPGDDPEVLGVGGTIATTDGSGNRTSETGWSGSGGGWKNNTDSFNHLPTWQTGNGVLTGIDKRLQPDIGGHSAAANGAYYLWFGGSLYYISGTSCASPDTAGCLSIVEQRLAAGGQTSRLGRIQDLIYSMNGRADVWYDVVSGSNGSLPNGAGSNCQAGWDPVTGWGAPNWDAFYTAIARTTVAPTAIQTFRGNFQSGVLTNLFLSDNLYMIWRPGVVLSTSEAPVDLIVSSTSPIASPSSIAFTLESKSSVGNIGQTLSMFDYVSNAWVPVDFRQTTLSDGSITVTISTNASRYVHAGDQAIKTRFAYKPTGPIVSFPYNISIDQSVWTIAP